MKFRNVKKKYWSGYPYVGIWDKYIQAKLNVSIWDCLPEKKSRGRKNDCKTRQKAKVHIFL